MIRVEAHTKGLLFYRSFVRIRVAIDTQQPLPRGLWLQWGQGNDDIWLTFKYEKLSNFCYDCGRLGHEHNSCKFVSTEERASSHYGPELRTTTAGNTGLPNAYYRRAVDELEDSLAPILTGRNKPPVCFNSTAKTRAVATYRYVQHSFTASKSHFFGRAMRRTELQPPNTATWGTLTSSF